MAEISDSNNGDQNRHERAQARWAILRNALLHKARETPTTEDQFSIHRFAGYELIKRQTVTDAQVDAIQSNLKNIRIDSTLSLDYTVELIAIRLLALGCLPSSSKFSLRIEGLAKEEQGKVLGVLSEKYSNSFQIQEQNVKTECDSLALNVIQIRGPKSTLYQCCQYSLDDKCSIITREPKQTHLSLQDLVSHRTVKVDNTGNICVWDSEKTLSYFLFKAETSRSLVPNETRSILELGTGMCGLSGLSLGLRLAQSLTQNETIKVVLTDGHSDGVKNNKINQHLTQAHGCESYDRLDIFMQELLWDTRSSADNSFLENFDVCLVSDCTHFQNYHAALAVTIARSLRVGGRAILCQPQRGGSLDNFLAMINTLEQPIFQLDEWKHQELEIRHRQSVKNFEGTYDEQVHRPSILLLTKLRALTSDDCSFLEQQQLIRTTNKA
jgi:SAM-dependent methyltransferase